MIIDLLMLMLLAFSSLYPLTYFYLGTREVMPSFTSYHFGFPCCLSSIFFVCILLFRQHLFFWGLLWLSSLLISCYFCWNKKTFNFLWTLLPFVFGFLFLILGGTFFWRNSWVQAILFLMTFLPSVSAVFACSLGHWYLNDVGLPVKYLVPSVWGLFVTSSLRLLWFIFHLLTFQVNQYGDMIYLYQLRGFYFFVVILGVLGAIIFPCIISFHTLSILKKKATQEATGLLYVVLLSMCVGEIALKVITLQWGGMI